VSIRPAQCRAARALIDMGQAELARVGPRFAPRHRGTHPALFGPGICWSGFSVNRSGSIVHRLQTNS
jgi:hypothetical protein